MSRPTRLALLASFGCLASCGTEAPALGSISTVVEEGAGNPTAAIREDGTAVVAWVGGGGPDYDVYTALVDPTGSVEGPFRVNDVDGDAAPHEQAPARVVTGVGGDVWVVWPNSTPVVGRRFPASDLRVAHSIDGGRSFGPTKTVNSDAGGVPASHTFHNAVVDSKGRLVVSWLDSRAQWEEVARDAGWQPGDPAPGDPPATGAEVGPELRVAVASGEVFGPSEAVVDRGTCPCCRTNLAVGPDGALFVAWRAVLPESVRDIVLARSDDGGGTWSAPVRVHADDWVFEGCPHAGPGLAVGDDGRVHVTWYTGREGGVGLYYATSADGGRSFSAPVPLTDGFVAPSQARLASWGDAALVAWEVRTPEGPMIRVARVEGSGVGPHVAISGALPEWATPRTGSGRLLTWLDGKSIRSSWIE